jgi:hypothetical protein
MKTKMKTTSLEANHKTKKTTGCENFTYTEIAEITQMKVPTVVARINDLMYWHQKIKIVGFKTENGYTKAIYGIRLKSDPLNVSPVSEFEKNKLKLQEIKEYCERINKTSFRAVSMKILEILEK